PQDGKDTVRCQKTLDVGPGLFRFIAIVERQQVEPAAMNTASVIHFLEAGLDADLHAPAQFPHGTTEARTHAQYQAIMMNAPWRLHALQAHPAVLKVIAQAGYKGTDTNDSRQQDQGQPQEQAPLRPTRDRTHGSDWLGC